jgi:ribosomal protein S18 acetylase RimI-like enzyme
MILPDKLSKKFPKNNYIPAIKLAHLAVANEYKGRGYGKYLVLNAIKRVLKNYIDLGMYAIFVDPKSEGVIPFYEKFGFSLLSNGITMYLPLRNLVISFCR